MIFSTSKNAFILFFLFFQQAKIIKTRSNRISRNSSFYTLSFALYINGRMRTGKMVLHKKTEPKWNFTRIKIALNHSKSNKSTSKAPQNHRTVARNSPGNTFLEPKNPHKRKISSSEFSLHIRLPQNSE